MEDPLDDTTSYRREVLDKLRKLEAFERNHADLDRRTTRNERDIVQIKNVLYGNPDERGLRDGDRGGLVDLFRELRRDVKKIIALPTLIRILIILSAVSLIRGIPPSVWKSIGSLFP